MTVDFILHGVPNGQDFWGASDDNHYFSTFYVQKNEKEYLSIEARKVFGKTYCYYNYLKYNNVIAADGRAGAYLGITLRFDAYYKDILNIYQIFEVIYNNLLNSILEKNGENVKFKIPKFEVAERELTEIKKKVVSLIQLSANAQDFTALNDSFFSVENKTVQAFLLDCTPENVLQALKKYGKVDISKYYPSNNEVKKISIIEERYASAISQMHRDLSEKNININKLTEECSNLKNEIERLGNLNVEKETIIKDNEASIKQVEELRFSVEKLKSGMEAKDREISQLKNELNRCKDSRKQTDMVKGTKKTLKDLPNQAGRQPSQFHKNSSFDSCEDTSFDNANFTGNVRERVSFFEKPVSQIIIIVFLSLILCVSLFCACQVAMLNNKKEMSGNSFDVLKDEVLVEKNTKKEQTDANQRDIPEVVDEQIRESSKPKEDSANTSDLSSRKQTTENQGKTSEKVDNPQASGTTRENSKK